jgi:acyl-CoA reductase-like NAD-dependent aldehyde dehydrogenase
MAVDSFLAFKKLMVKRNQELNRQAMELFNKKQGGGDASAEATTDKPTATGAPTTTDGKPATDEATKKAQEELKEVMRVAHSLERAEEEEMMKRALEESGKLQTEEQKASEEEERMIREAIEASQREEQERLAKERQESGLTD